ncbi:cadherin domain-containing protein [Ditylenchus destructor]|nr:cadherin domain-containing protein [Ditylenchus destructor]
MFKILSFLVFLFISYCTGDENTNAVHNVSMQSAAEAALHKALGELRSKVDVNAVLEPASVLISEGPSHSHVTAQSDIDDVPSTTISMLEMDAVQPGQIQTAAKFDFVPHFEDTTFEFMMSEGVNKVDNVVAIVSFYGLLDGSVPEFSVKFDRLNYFAIGEISMQQSNYLLSFVPIVLRSGVTVALADANNGIYKFKIQATQGEHQSESTVKVEIAKFQPPPLNNSSDDSVELWASSVPPADLEELATAQPSSEDSVTEGADLVLGSGSLATDFPLESVAIPTEDESNSNMDNMDTMVDSEFPTSDGAGMPEDTAMMSDPLLFDETTTASVGVKNNTVHKDNQMELLEESMTKGVTSNPEMAEERKEETTEEPQEEVLVEAAENTKTDEGNSGIQEENMPDLSPSGNNTLDMDTEIQPHEGTMLGKNGETNSEINDMSDNSMSGSDMMEENNGDTNDDMMPKEETQQDASGNVQQELENDATTIQTGETAAPQVVDIADHSTNENNIDRNQENTEDFETNLNDLVQIQVTGLQKDSTIRLSGNLPAGKILPNLEVKVTVNNTQAIDEVIQLWIEPNTMLDIKPHFVMPGDTVKFVTVQSNFTGDSNERDEIISLKARFANHEVHKRLGALAETKLFVKSDARARLSEKMKLDKVMYEFEISEWASTGSKIGLIQVDTKSMHTVVRYSVFGRDSQKFTIENDGILYVNCNGTSTCLDRETTPMYQFAVIATDSVSGQSSPPALVSIVVGDENDNGPLLKLYDNEVVVTSGEILTPFLITTIDHDTEVNQNNELELVGEAATFLVVDKLSTGLWQLRVKSYTEPGEYKLNISAIDILGKNPLDSTIVKVIVIEPESSIRFRRNVYERAISSEKIVKEGISIDAVTFVILENPGWLAIESFGGNIFVGDVPRKGIKSGRYIATVAAVDRESQKILAKCQNATILIMDNHLLINVEKLGDIRFIYLILSNGEQNATVSILVRSDSEKELMKMYTTSKPRFIEPWISEEIPIKELPNGYTLVHIPAYNPMDMKAISNFSLTGKDVHYFRVDSSTGTIYLQESIDFEAVSESSTSRVILEFQLHAFNQIECNNRQMCQMTESVANFHVEVLNIDDATPTLNIIGPNIVEIPENSPIGTLVAQLSCQDRDSQRLNLQLSGKESANFHIRQIEIRLLDENDNRPLFISPSMKDIKVYNNWPAGVALMRFQAGDKDLGLNARIIYTIKDDNNIAKYLTVDGATGVLSTNVSMSSADTSQPYTVTVLASDHPVTPKFTSTTTVLIHVLEAVSLSENALQIIQPAIGHVLEVPEAIDVSDQDWLRINEETGEVFTAAQFDFEQQEFITRISYNFLPWYFLILYFAISAQDCPGENARLRLTFLKMSRILKSVTKLQWKSENGVAAFVLGVLYVDSEMAANAQQIGIPFDEKEPQHESVTDLWSARFRELQKSLRSSKKSRHKQHVPLSRQQSLIVSEDLAHTEPPYHTATYRNSIRAASADDILEAGGHAYDHQQSMLNYSTHFPVNEYPAVAVSVSGQLRDPYGGYIFPHLYGYGDEEKANMWNAEPTDTSTSALGEGYSHTTESGYGSTRGAVPSSMTEIGGKVQQSSPRASETAFTEGSGSYYQYSPTTRTLLKIRQTSPPSRSQQEAKGSPVRSGTSRRAQSPRGVVMPQFSLGMLSPKSLQTLSRPPGSGELARNQPRYGRTRTDIGMRQLARSEQDLGFRRRRLSTTQSAKANQAIEFLKSRIRETKYVTAVFESHKEFAHWLGPKSHLLAVACEVHWSVPEKVRSRAMEIEMKDCLHRALRDNNQRVLNIYEEIRRDLPLSFVESKTEESCGKESRVDAFQGNVSTIAIVGNTKRSHITVPIPLE